MRLGRSAVSKSKMEQACNCIHPTVLTTLLLLNHGKYDCNLTVRGSVSVHRFELFLQLLRKPILSVIQEVIQLHIHIQVTAGYPVIETVMDLY